MHFGLNHSLTHNPMIHPGKKSLGLFFLNDAKATLLKLFFGTEEKGSLSICGSGMTVTKRNH